MKHVALVICLSMAVVAHADPTPPSLVWTGDPTVTPGSGFSFTPDANGINVGAGIEAGIGGGEFDYLASRFFDVLSPGYFLLTSTVEVGVSAEVCNIFLICPGVSANLTGSVFVQSTVQSLSASKSAPGTENPLTDCTFLGGSVNCGAVDLGLSDSASNLVFLSTGNQVLIQAFDLTFSSGGSSGFSASFETDLVPTPEPRGCAVLSGLVLAGWLVGAGRRKNG